MHFFIVSILAAALGTFANPLAPPDEPSDTHNSDLAVNVDSHELFERGKGGYVGSCTNIRYYLGTQDMKVYELSETNPNFIIGKKPFMESPVLVARCPNLSDQTKCSVLRLGDCMANREGQLQPSKNGNWHETCTQCRFVDDGKYFYCRCYTGKGKDLQETTINLNNFISNWDGNLMCFANKGTPKYCPHGPSFEILNYGSSPYPYDHWEKPAE
ncbi:hypothetical protein QQZ08_011505 [Neonectria magnoliae]|uniref:Cyanovirin-N domain-containing protein n=1 Tax=Neonectria magnoliae TaxID=2732573 RepID=A0ABR1H9T8_9HYPO